MVSCSIDGFCKQARLFYRPVAMHILVAFVLTSLSLSPGMSYSAPVAKAEEPPESASKLASPAQMSQSLDSAIISHHAGLAGLKNELLQLEALQDEFQSDISAYNARNTAHGQMLLVSQLRIEDLEYAINSNRLTSRALAQTIARLQNQLDATVLRFKMTSERIELARSQIDDIQRAQLSGNQKKKLEAKTRNLIEVLQEKKALGDRIVGLYKELLDQTNQTQAATVAIETRLLTRLENRKRALLFSRSGTYRDFGEGRITENLRFFTNRLAAIFKLTTWEAQWAQIKLGGAARWAVFIAALVFVIVFQSRCRTLIKLVEKRCEGKGWNYRSLGLRLLRRALPYLGMTILFGIYNDFDLTLLDIGLTRFLLNFFLILLITRLGLDYLNFGFRGPPTVLRTFVAGHLKRFFRFFRAGVIFVIMLAWVAGRDNLLSWLAWDILSVIYLFWAVVFWREMKTVLAEGVREGQAAPAPQKVAMLRNWSYLVLGGTLLLSLVGFKNLAGHWLGSWIATVALFFWGWISLNAIQEWHHDHRVEAAATDEDHPLGSGHPWRWSLIQLARLVWLVGLAVGLLLAWDFSGFLFSWVGALMGITMTLGSLKLSIANLALALLIIFFAHLAVRVGKTLLHDRILDRQPLERGLKDSILTIAGYLGWGLGLILSLGALGVNATSLAVVFGALSIGIGFGLQNIFNNFISGLILLFERPIQVGDYVELGEAWAEVKKINVRSTVVKTFDNAAVIIPNSDFISQRVTNWSFRDKRMRRRFHIRVAYGSDIDLVMKTLRDVALELPGVLHYPRPDVFFIDHAENGLTFLLRIWVNVDDYFSVPSEVLCEIHRRFSALGIEIGFSQQELRIRQLSDESGPPAGGNE